MGFVSDSIPRSRGGRPHRSHFGDHAASDATRTGRGSLGRRSRSAPACARLGSAGRRNPDLPESAMTRSAWTRRQEAARKYRPKTIRLLLVAEAPPEEENRYFYFE